MELLCNDKFVCDQPGCKFQYSHPGPCPCGEGQLIENPDYVIPAEDTTEIVECDCGCSIYFSEDSIQNNYCDRHRKMWEEIYKDEEE